MDAKQLRTLKSNKNLIGHWIKDQRKAKGWTQVQLAQKLKWAQADISDYENGKQIPGKRRCPGLAKVFNVDPSDVHEMRVMSELADTLART
jgi:transcriptional regulator with XRE-family HTH domain